MLPRFKYFRFSALLGSVDAVAKVPLPSQNDIGTLGRSTAPSFPKGAIARYVSEVKVSLAAAASKESAKSKHSKGTAIVRCVTDCKK